jgi:hypothetical protein
MRLDVTGCIMRVKNKIDLKTKEPLMSVKDFEDRTLEAKEMLEKGRVITFIYCKIYFLRGEDR